MGFRVFGLWFTVWGECIWESGFNSTEKTDCSLHIGLRGKFGKKEKLGKIKIRRKKI